MTRLPRFDIHRDDRPRTSYTTSSLPLDEVERPAILQRYARWLCAVVGEEEAAFAFVQGAEQEVHIMRARHDGSHNKDEVDAVGEQSAFLLLLNVTPQKVEQLQRYACITTITLDASSFSAQASLSCTGHLSQKMTENLLQAFCQPLTHRRAPSVQEEDHGNLLDDEGSLLLHHNVHHWIRQTPDAVALDFLDQHGRITSLTYADLDRRANRLALALRARWLDSGGPSRCVPLYVDQSIGYYVALLACLKAGFIFSPIPFDAPDERIAAQCKDQDARIALYSSAFSEKPLADQKLPTEWYDIAEYEEESEACAKDDLNPLEQCTPDSLAYILYTSGTTGKPKGVQITHRSITTSINTHIRLVGWSTTKKSQTGMRWFQFAAPTFDPSLMEIFITFGTGNTLCAAPRHVTLSRINETVATLRATIMMATPSLARLIYPSRIPTLKCLWSMGEALNDDVIDRFAHIGSDQPAANDSCVGLYNGYGPTEASVTVTLTKVLPTIRGTVLGPAVPSARLHVVDVTTLETMPIGLVGELIIGGDQVSQLGYLNRPKESQESFVFRDELGGRVYRTGDLARIVENDDGERWFEILGRISGSRQVKVHGQRIELREVEESIRRIVPNFPTMVVQRPNGTLAGVVYVERNLASSKKQSILKELQDAASSALPSFMRPKAYVFSSQTFVSAAGKQDLPKLQKHLDDELGNGSNTGSKTFDLSDDAVSRLVETVSVITNTSVHPSNSLHEVGLDSMGALRLLDAVRDDKQLCGLTLTGAAGRRMWHVPIHEIVDTLRRIASDGARRKKNVIVAEYLQSFAAESKEHCRSVLGEHTPIEAVLPVTSTQIGILTSFMSKQSYVHHFCYRLAREVDIERLCEAVSTVCSSSDALRSTFVEMDDERSPFAQCVLAGVKHTVARVTLDDRGLDEEHKRLVKEQLHILKSSFTLNGICFSANLFQGAKQTTLSLTFLHAIFDGGSLHQLVNTIERLYAAPGEQIAHTVKTDALYAISAHLEDTLDDETAKTTDAYWSKELAGMEEDSFPIVHGLRPQALVETDGSDACEVRSSWQSLQSWQSALSQKTARSKVTPLAVAQLAWSVLLNEYSELPVNEAVFGSLMSNRLDGQAQRCTAPTFTTIPVRVNLPAESTVLTLLQERVMKAKEALAHSQPLLKTLLGSQHRLPFDTVLALQLFADSVERDGILQDRWSPAMSNDFSVMLEIWPGSHANDPLRFRATYKTSHLDQSSCKTLLRQFDSLLNSITSVVQTQNEEHTIEDLFNQMAGADRSLVADVGDRAVEQEVYDSLLLHNQFEQIVKVRPNQQCLLYQVSRSTYTTLTYAQMNERAEKIARHMQALYASFGSTDPLRDTIVPLYADKTVGMLVCVLAILKAGAAWCPIDPSLPLQRRTSLLRRLSAKLLMVSLESDGDEQLEDVHRLAEQAGVVHLCNLGKEGLLPDVDQHAQLNLAQPRPNDLAYVIWTSGSTGEPKGVMVEHRAAARAMIALQNSIHSGEQAPITLNFAAFTFDVFVQDLFYTWGLGGTLVAAPQRAIIDVDDFRRIASETRATHAHLTPSFGACIDRETCETLKVITMIGERLDDRVADVWQGDSLIQTWAYNTYGPAENAVVSTYRTFQSDENHQASNVGWPLEGVECRVVRSDGRTATLRGGTGELMLVGGQVARGYLNDAKKTSAVFSGWQDEDANKTYRTGDIVRMLSDGSLDFVGRRDDLVKLGGIRVELSEISSALAHAHPQLQHIETLHLPISQTSSKKVVVAFLVVPTITEVGDGHLIEEVIESARQQADRILPLYMHPAQYVVVAKIPRSPSAKMDKRALAAQFFEHVTKTQGATSNETFAIDENVDESSAEAKLAMCVATTVGMDSKHGWRAIVGNKQHSLRAFGLDSIAVIRLASQIRKAGLSTSIAAFAVMKCASFEDLKQEVLKQEEKNDEEDLIANALDLFDAEWSPVVCSLTGLGENDVQETLPLTHLQTSLLSETAKNYLQYWSSIDFDVQGHTHETITDGFSRAMNVIEALRSTFVATAHGYVQLVLHPTVAQQKFDTAVQVFAADVDDQCLDEAHQTVCEEKQRQKAPLFWSLSVIKDPSSDGKLSKAVLHIHHALYDADGLRLILNTALMNKNESMPSVTQTRRMLTLLSPTAIHWFVPMNDPQEEEDKVRSALRLRQESEDRYWRDLFSKYASLCLPWQLPNLSSTTKDSMNVTGMHTHSLRLTCAQAQIEQASASVHLSTSAFIQSAFGMVLNAYLEQECVLIGTTLSERFRSIELEHAVAPLIVTVPFLMTGKGFGDETLAHQALQSQAKQWKGVTTSRHVAARTMRQALGWPTTQALYAALFVVHEGQTQQAANGKSNPIGRISVEHEMAMNVFLDESGAVDELELSVSREKCSAEHVKTMVRQIDCTVSWLVNLVSGGKSSSELPSELLAVQGPVEVAEPPHSDVFLEPNPCRWVADYAQKRPEWIAVQEADPEDGFKVREWTYAELDRITTKLASGIRAELDRIVSDSSYTNGTPVVAICMDRSLEAFAAILATFKAGCFYLPIAEDLPSDRKCFLARNASASLIITSAGLDDAFSEDPALKDVVRSVEALSALDGETVVRQKAWTGGYILYTSGSTGTPKGVCVSSANLNAFVEGYASILMHHSDRTSSLSKHGQGRYLNLASRAFDPHIAQMFVAWRLGYAAVTGVRAALLADLQETIARLQISHVGLLPSLLEQTGLVPEQAPSLAFVGVGGEKVTEFVIRHWGREDVQNRELPLSLNMYGPTETTIGCTNAVIRPSMHSNNIGYPIGHTSTVILLPNSSSIALRGQPGELCIAGALVAEGQYLGREKNDQGGFIKVPKELLPRTLANFATENGSITLYRTGDMACMLADGSISFLGRKDEQIKIRGQRLELGEVTASVCTAAAEFTGIASTKQEALTVYLKHPSLGASRLFTILAKGGRSSQSASECTFLSSSEGGNALLIQEISARCQEMLPAFMVPSIVLIDRIPRLASGKTDGKRLTKMLMEMEIDRILPSQRKPEVVRTGHVSTQRSLTETEEAVADAIRATINIPEGQVEIRAETSIFELGIDSLSVVGLTVRLRGIKALSDLSVASVLQKETVEEIASIQAHNITKEAESVFSHPESFDAKARQVLQAEVDNIELVRPSMPMQQNLLAISSLALSNLDGDGVPYVYQFSVKSDESPQALHDRWMKGIAEQPILRTIFRQVHLDGQATTVQVVLKPEAIALRGIWSEKSSTEASFGIVQSADRVPPLRVQIKKNEEDDGCYSLITIHHALYDGFTLPLLLQDVFTAGHKSSVEAREAALEHDQALLQHAIRCQSDTARRSWGQYFDGYQPPSRSLGALETPKEVTKDKLLRFKLCWSSDDLQSLRSNVVQRYKTTLSNALQACFAILVARSLGKNDVVVGNVVNGRHDFAHLRGAMNSRMPCIATVPVRHRLQSRSLNAAIRESKQSIAQTREWQQTPLRMISRCAPQLKGRALFEALFAFENANDAQTTSDIEIPPMEDEHVNFPLVLNVVDKISTLEATLAVSSASVGAGKGSQFAEQLQVLVGLLREGLDGSLESLGIPIDPSDGSVSLSAEGLAPRDELFRALTAKEEKALEVLAIVLADLNPADVHPRTSFYELGLDSLNAIRFAAELRKHGFEAITPTNILNAGCLGELCKDPLERSEDVHVGKTPTDERKAEVSVSSRVDGAVARGLFEPLVQDDCLEAWYECSPLQSGMLTVSQDDPHSAYRQIHSLTLRDEVESKRLQQAWLAVVRHLDVLRTTFHLVNDHWIGLVHSQCSANHSLRSSWDEFANAPLAFLQIDGTTASFAIHHALYDGESLPLLFDLVREAYFVQEPNRLPDVEPYHRWMEEVHRDAKDNVQLWSDSLHKYRYTPPQTCKTLSRDGKSFFGSAQSSSEGFRLNEGCRRLGVTLHAVSILACAKMIGSTVLKSRDVCMGHVLSARGLQTSSKDAITIGPLFNTVARRVQFQDLLQPNIEAIKTVQRQVDASRDWLWAPLADVLKQWRLNEPRNKNAPRLFDVLFVFHQETARDHTTSEAKSLWKAGKEDERAEEGTHSEYPVNISVSARLDHSIEVRVKGTEDIFGDSEGVQQFAQSILDSVLRIVHQPDQLVCQSPTGFSSMRFGPSSDESSDHGAESEQLDLRLVEQQEEALCTALRILYPSSAGAITPETNLFDLGVDSITALRLIRQVRKEGGILASMISVVMILERQTVTAIARQAILLHSKRREPTRSVEYAIEETEKEEVLASLQARSPVQAKDIQAVLPTLAGQQFHLHLWYLSGFRFLEPMWNYTCPDQRLDATRMQRAWEGLQHQYAVLRSTFVPTSSKGKLRQVVLSANFIRRSGQGFRSFVEDSEESSEARLRSLNKQAQHEHFDLFSPPCRLTMIIGPRSTNVCIRLHHALYDAMTISRLIRGLERNYSADDERVEKDDRTPVKQISRVTMAQDSAAREGREWWRKSLLKAQHTIVFAEIKTRASHSLLLRIPSAMDKLSALEERARKNGVQLQHLITLALAKTLSRRTGNLSNPTFGLYTAGRSNSSMDMNDVQMTFPHLNLLPFSADLSSSSATLSEQLRSVKASLIERIRYEQASLLDVTEECNGGKPMFDCFLNLLWHTKGEGDESEKVNRESIRLEHVRVPEAASYFSSNHLHSLIDTTGKATTTLGTHLDTSYLPQSKLFIDIRKDLSKDCLSMGIKVEEANVDEEFLRSFAKDLMTEVRTMSDTILGS